MIEWRKVRRAAASMMMCCVLITAACSSDGGDDDKDAGKPTTRPSDGDGGEFGLLSYNVAGLPAEVSEVDPKKHLPLVSPLLNDYDVVMSQEDFDWWKDDGLAAGLDFVNYHDRLIAEATHEFKSERHPGMSATTGLSEERLALVEVGDGLAFLSRFPIGGNTRVPWTGCFGSLDVSDGGAADCLALKGFALTRMTLADGLEVDLYNVHGEAGGTEKDQQLQAEDFKQLSEFIVEHSEGRAVVVGGDTNLHTDRVHEDSGDGADIEIWSRFLTDTNLTDACAATDCPEPGRIDKVAFRSGEGVDLEALTHEFHADRFVDEAGEPLSDHEPLEVRFAWRPA